MSPTSRRVRGAAAAAALSLTCVPALVAVPALAHGTGVRAAATEGADRPTLKVAITADFETFNPFTTIYAAPININRLQFESLVEVGGDNSFVPGMAESWEVSEDGTQWTYTIPDGRTWSDGEPVTAEDPEWTLTQIKDDPELGTANGSLLEGVESIEATDENTLVLTLAEPQASNPVVDIPIVPKHVWENIEDKAGYLTDVTEPVVGSGPFQIQSYAKSQFVELTANDSFWRGPAKIGGITYTYYRNTDAAVQGLQAGETDLVSGLTVAQFESLEGQENIATSNGKGRRYSGISLNAGTTDIDGNLMGDGNPVLHDPEVRRAILSAIDNQALIDRVLGGYATPGVTQIPPVYPEFFGLPEGATERTFDLDEANRILDEAGYTQKNADGIRLDRQGAPIVLRLAGSDTSPSNAQMATFISEWLSEIGIGTTVQMMSSSQLGNDSTIGNYDTYFTGWGIGPDPDFQLSINQCSSRPNADGSGATSENNLCDPAFDALFAQQHTEQDPERRAELVKEAFQVVYDANVLDVIAYVDGLEAWRSDRFVDFPRQPENDGVIYGQSSYWGMWGAEPVGSAEDGEGGTSAGAQDDGTNVGLIAGIGVGVLALVGIGIALTRRRSATSDERE